MTSFRNSICCAFCALAISAGVLGAPVQAQVLADQVLADIDDDVVIQNKAAAKGDAAKLLENVQSRISKGRLQLERNQPAAVETLRAASQYSLNALVAYIGPQVLTAPPEEMPRVGIWADATRQAAEAHYWWGRAADQFAMRDEAVTAFARASRFAGRLRPGSANTLARDSLLALGGTLRDGLPLVAPDDTLTTVAEIAHGKLWEPRRFAFRLPDTQLPTAAGNASRENSDNAREFLITSGRVYPPVPSSTVDVSAALSRVPPIYRNVEAEALPDVLRLDRMAVGYYKEISGPDKGMWRQAVCVFYASTYLTRNRRDDQKRAEATCAQFLKVHALMRNALGQDAVEFSNPYNRNQVTNIWLSEVSALWPADDNDPRVRDAVGIIMPKINTPTTGTKLENREIEVQPNSYPWGVFADENQSAPGDILLFQMNQPRDEAARLSELTHEYGHVLLPAFGNFKAPSEPFANGLIGETLAAMWAASAPSAWEYPAEFGLNWDRETFALALSTQVAAEAMPALRAWKTRGPASPLRRDLNQPGLQYLQGAAVYIERVYGAEILGAAFSPLIAKPAKSSDADAAPKIITTDALMVSFPAALNKKFPAGPNAEAGVLPIWLPGAIDGVNISPADFTSRANLRIKAGTKFSAWLYVPLRARFLHMEWMAEIVSLESLQSNDKLPISRAKAVTDFGKYGDAAKYDVRGKTGWQRFSFTARTDMELIAAQFEQ